MTESQRKNAESQRKMPDREKVLRGLECCIKKLGGERVCDECPYDEDFNCLGCDVVLRQAIAMLREQEPVEPVVDARDGWYRCGGCGNSLASGERVRSFGAYKWPVYCEKCGKKVDWGD